MSERYVITAQDMEQMGSWELESAKIMAKTIVDELSPLSVVDIGSGPAVHANELFRLGVPWVEAYDDSEFAANMVSPGVEFRLVDISAEPFEKMLLFDVALCFEVLEHIDESREAAAVRNIAAMTRSVLVFSAAAPGQPGCGHVNCKPRDHWIEAFGREGLAYDEETTKRWRAEWESGSVVYWYTFNLLVLRRS
jgi:SAM-dependent methyltransferase